MSHPASVSISEDAGIVFGSGAYAPKANASNDFGEVSPEAVITLAHLESYTARQSRKIDLGSDAGHYVVMAAIETGGSAPEKKGVVEFYWAPSAFPAAGRGNPGGIDGRDSRFNGYSGGDVIMALQHLELIGVMPLDCVTRTIQVAYLGIFAARMRYGSLVVFNKSSAALEQDDTEMAVVFRPV